jgi:hypothetical protein
MASSNVSGATVAGNAQLTRVVLIAGIGLAGLAILYFGVARPVLCKLRVIDCKKQSQEDEQILQNFDNKGFDPTYWQNRTVTLSWDRAKQLAANVYNAGGVFNDDESAFYAVLQEAKTYANLSFIAYNFQNKYKQSLAEYYAYYLDAPEEQQKIKTILQELK